MAARRVAHAAWDASLPQKLHNIINGVAFALQAVSIAGDDSDIAEDILPRDHGSQLSNNINHVARKVKHALSRTEHKVERSMASFLNAVVAHGGQSAAAPEVRMPTGRATGKIVQSKHVQVPAVEGGVNDDTATDIAHAIGLTRRQVCVCHISSLFIRRCDSTY